jgi:hypothetical protein
MDPEDDYDRESEEYWQLQHAREHQEAMEQRAREEEKAADDALVEAYLRREEEREREEKEYYDEVGQRGGAPEYDALEDDRDD